MRIGKKKKEKDWSGIALYLPSYYFCLFAPVCILWTIVSVVHRFSSPFVLLLFFILFIFKSFSKDRKPISSLLARNIFFFLNFASSVAYSFLCF